MYVLLQTSKIKSSHLDELETFSKGMSKHMEPSVSVRGDKDGSAVATYAGVPLRFTLHKQQLFLPCPFFPLLNLSPTYLLK